MTIKVNFKRHYLYGVHCGETFSNYDFKMTSWQWACEWAHLMSCSQSAPEYIVELENVETGEVLDLSRYSERTINQKPIKKPLRDKPQNPYKLVPYIPQRRSTDGTEKQKESKK